MRDTHYSGVALDWLCFEHRHLDCLFNRFFKITAKKAWTFHISAILGVIDFVSATIHYLNKWKLDTLMYSRIINPNVFEYVIIY